MAKYKHTQKEAIAPEDYIDSKFYEVKCGDCSQLLVTLLVSEDLKVKTTIKVQCPFCGGESYQHKHIGHIRINPSEKLNISTIDIIEFDNELQYPTSMIVKVQKK